MRVRPSLSILLIASVVVLFGPSITSAASPPSEPDSVIACESLIGLRQLVVQSQDDRAVAAQRIASYPGCRVLPKARFGAVERRTIVGGAPYECLALEGAAACVWVMP